MVVLVLAQTNSCRILKNNNNSCREWEVLSEVRLLAKVGAKVAEVGL